MAYVTQIEDIANTPTGEQIVSTDMSGYTRGLAGAIDSVGSFANVAHQKVAEHKAGELVRDAEKQVAKETADFETAMAAEGEKAVAQVATGANLLDKGVKQGKVPRESARLRAAQLVVNGIQENPFFAQRMRQVAGSLLGFDPNTEVHRQFFSAFDTRDEIARANAAGTKKTAFWQKAHDIAQATGQPVAEVANDLGKAQISAAKLQVKKDLLESGEIDANQFINELAEDTLKEEATSVWTDISAEIQANGTIDLNTYNKVVQDHKLAFITAGQQALADAGHGGTDSLSKLKQRADMMFDPLLESASTFDAKAMTQEELAYKKAIYAIKGMEAFPAMTALRFGVGERIAGQVFEIMRTTNKHKREALKQSSHLQPFIEFAEMSDKEFKAKFFNAMEKHADPTVTRDDITPQEQALVDSYYAQQAKTMTPEDRGEAAVRFLRQGYPNKANSLVIGEGAIKIPRADADPQVVNYVKNEWANTMANQPRTIANIIKQGEKSLTDRGLYLGVNSAGTLSLYQDTKMSGRRQATQSPAWGEIQKINTYLNSADWAGDLGVTNKEQAAKKIIRLIELEMKRGE